MLFYTCKSADSKLRVSFTASQTGGAKKRLGEVKVLCRKIMQFLLRESVLPDRPAKTEKHEQQSFCFATETIAVL